MGDPFYGFQNGCSSSSEPRTRICAYERGEDPRDPGRAEVSAFWEIPVDGPPPSNNDVFRLEVRDDAGNLLGEGSTTLEFSFFDDGCKSCWEASHEI
jgi:hypothetical protein